MACLEGRDSIKLNCTDFFESKEKGKKSRKELLHTQLFPVNYRTRAQRDLDLWICALTSVVCFNCSRPKAKKIISCCISQLFGFLFTPLLFALL